MLLKLESKRNIHTFFHALTHAYFGIAHAKILIKIEEEKFYLHFIDRDVYTLSKYLYLLCLVEHLY